MSLNPEKMFRITKGETKDLKMQIMIDVVPEAMTMCIKSGTLTREQSDYLRIDRLSARTPLKEKLQQCQEMPERIC